MILIFCNEKLKQLSRIVEEMSGLVCIFGEEEARKYLCRHYPELSSGDVDWVIDLFKLSQMLSADLTNLQKAG